MSDVAPTMPPTDAKGHPVIRARKLARWYGPIMGLTDVDLDIPAGITGLLGPNGAGKSTFLRLLTGQLLPNDGALTVFDACPWTTPEVFNRIGFCSEDDALFEDLTPLQMVTFLARCSGFPLGEARERAHAALVRTGIAHAKDRRSGGFSKGMRQRTRLAAAIVHDPDLLLLDEPMTGLDPVGRRDVVKLIEGLAAEGKSVLFSSHILHEVEAVARHVVVLNRGMVLAEGSLAHIRSCLSDYAFTLEVVCDAPRRLAAALSALDYVTSLGFPREGTLAVGSDSARRLLLELPGVVLDLGIEVKELACPGENLETLFQRLVRS